MKKIVSNPTLQKLKTCTSTKVSFFVQCTKTQLIILQNFNMQTCFSQFLWFFQLKGQMIYRIHLDLPNADNRGVYLYLIFEMSIWEFITNSKKKHISNQT